MLLLPTLLAALAAVTPAASQATATGTTSTSDAEVSASSSSATLSATPGIEPTSPYGETVAKIGGELKALWDTVSGTPWTNMTIELMTGSNQEMVHLATLGSGIDAMETAEFKFTVPEVDPPSQIYFLQFTNPPYTDKLWTTRFTITEADGTSSTPLNEETTADGEVVGWGIGTLLATNGTIAHADHSNSTSTETSTEAGADASASATGTSRSRASASASASVTSASASTATGTTAAQGNGASATAPATVLAGAALALVAFLA